MFCMIQLVYRILKYQIFTMIIGIISKTFISISYKLPQIIFKAKGRHDHSKPASKSFSNSLKRKGTQKQQHQDRSQKQIRMNSEVSSCMSPIKASYNQIHEFSPQVGFIFFHVIISKFHPS